MTAIPFGWSLGYAAALGACIGSFLNVVIYRVPRGRSLVHPGSRCPACDAAIRPWDNIPVLSWLWLRGRCRRCQSSIAWRYPAVEALTAAVAMLCAWRFGPSWQALTMFGLLAAMIAVAFIDWEHMIIPDGISLGFLGVGLLIAPVIGPGLWPAVVGALVGGGLLLAVGWIWEKTRGVEAMGGGDIKLMGAVGAFLGAVPVLLVIFLGAFFGAIFGTVLMRRDGQARIAFGTFLAAATLVVVFVGDAAVDWYLARLGLAG